MILSKVVSKSVNISHYFFVIIVMLKLTIVFVKYLDC